MIRLTQTVQKGGCAAKVAASELRKILAAVRFPKNPPELMVDGSLFDDAAIIRVSDTIALVQTLDFFTPIVDTPELFGKVAAANALSDVYAMGGTPKTAMAILAFPLATMDSAIVSRVLQGASDLLSEAGVPLVGGHSIDDDTLKFGLSVTGYVHPKKVWTNSGAKAGDVLILTKPLGTGTLTAALKRSELTENDIGDVIKSMTQLNRAPEILKELSSAVHAATDITGFGLAGHAMQMAKASKVGIKFDFSALPIFPGAWECLEKGILTKAHAGNAEYTKDALIIDGDLEEAGKLIMFDPQTSGGLLLAVEAVKVGDILKSLRREFLSAVAVGFLTDKNPGTITVKA
jgi:selenide,water dikinase